MYITISVKQVFTIRIVFAGKYLCHWCKINPKMMQVSCHKHRHTELPTPWKHSRGLWKVCSRWLCYKSTKVLSQSDSWETAGHWIGQSKIKEFIYYSQELLNLQSLHSSVNIMPAYFTLKQEEIDKLLRNAKEEITLSQFVFSSIIAVQFSNSITHGSNLS